jgi:hypothetical protein
MVSDKKAALPGDLAKDVVTGFEGIITGRSAWLHGCDRLNITPMKLGSDGTPIKEQSFDEDRIEIVKKAKAKATAPDTDRLKRLSLGAEAKDIVTGYKGIIAGVMITFGGAIHVFLEPEKTKKDGETYEMEAFYDTRIEVIKKKPIPKTTAKTSGKDGGPPPRGEGARVR